MKKTALTINGFAVLVTIASCLVAVGCEKSKGCEEYRPWPTAEAVAAWTAYSPELVNEWTLYNDVPTTLNYWGCRMRAYDSILVAHKEDTVMLCGYLKTMSGFERDGLYWLVPSPGSRIDAMNSVQLNLRHLVESQAIDTTHKVYLLAIPKVGTITQYLSYYPRDTYAASSCSQYEYVMTGIEIKKYE